MKKFILLILCLITSCSSLKKTIALGVGTGLATGATLGATMYEHNKGNAALKGALILGALGGIASYFIHGGLENRDAKVRKDTLFNLGRNSVSSPYRGQKTGHSITMPIVEEQWIETQVKGNKKVEGHRIWVITEPSRWEDGQ